MLIAIDYDDTWTRDRETFREVAQLFLNSGHKVVIVTLRAKAPNEALPFDIYCTNYQAKRQYMAKLGLRVDIWIDDNPKYICEDYIDPREPHWT